MDNLDKRFAEMKYCSYSNSQKLKGWGVILRHQKPAFFIKIGWELFTTFVVYSPSISSYVRDIIVSTRSNWNNISEEDKLNVIAALTALNKRGKIDKALNKY